MSAVFPASGTGPVEAALAALSRGRPVVVADDTDRENEGDLVASAAQMTPELMAFFLRHGSGIVCTPMPERRAAELDLPPMTAANTDHHGTAFTVSVDHVSTGTGISAADRAATVRALADPALRPGHLRRPGHLFPLRARPGGLAERRGHTEAAVELVRWAGTGEVGVITELVDDAGVPLAGERLGEFAAMHGLALVTVAELAVHRPTPSGRLRRTGAAVLPTRYGRFRAVAYRAGPDGPEHLALVHGDPVDPALHRRGVLTRVHSECLTGDLLGSLRCDCGSQLDAALHALAREPAGVLVYLRGHEGRGIGLGAKLAAYRLQEQGLDTLDANRALGLPVDDREYAAAAAILADLGITRVRLVTNNTAKAQALSRRGVAVAETVHQPPAVTAENLGYLETKRDRMGHALPAALAPAPALLGETG